jgi:hypothetical protein
MTTPEGSETMSTVIPTILVISCVILFPPLALSDCTDFGNYTSWYVQDDQTLVFYAQNVPIARVVLQDCTVNASSNIRLLKNYMCDSDSILIDGQECSILQVTSASSSNF